MTSNTIQVESFDKTIQDEKSDSSDENIEKEEDVTMQQFADDTIANIAPSQLVIDEEKSFDQKTGKSKKQSNKEIWSFDDRQIRKQNSIAQNLQNYKNNNVFERIDSQSDSFEGINDDEQEFNRMNELMVQNSTRQIQELSSENEEDDQNKDTKIKGNSFQRYGSQQIDQIRAKVNKQDLNTNDGKQFNVQDVTYSYFLNQFTQETQNENAKIELLNDPRFIVEAVKQQCFQKALKQTKISSNKNKVDQKSSFHQKNTFKFGKMNTQNETCFQFDEDDQMSEEFIQNYLSEYNKAMNHIKIIEYIQSPFYDYTLISMSVIYLITLFFNLYIRLQAYQDNIAIRLSQQTIKFVHILIITFFLLENILKIYIFNDILKKNNLILEKIQIIMMTHLVLVLIIEFILVDAQTLQYISQNLAVILMQISFASYQIFSKSKLLFIKNITFKYIDLTGRNSQFEKFFNQKQYYFNTFLKDSITENKNLTEKQKINKILTSLMLSFPQMDFQIFKDLNYCIETVKSGKLFETIKTPFQTQNSVIDKYQFFSQKRFSVDIKPTYVGYMWLEQYNDQPNEFRKFSNQKQKSKISSAISENTMSNISEIQSGTDKENLSAEYFYKLLKLNKESIDELEKIQSFNFNILNLRTFSKDKELVAVVCTIFVKEKIFTDIPINLVKIIPFLKKISQQYLKISYHNKTHGADLTQTFYHFCQQGDLIQICGIDKWEIMSLTIAAACHDVDHPGLNNLYLVESRHALSIRYNDVSVLENHHVATTFEIMTKEENKYNIFDKLDKDQFKKVRKIIIDSILATDMSNHFKKFEVLKTCVMQDDFNPKQADTKKIMLEWMFHLADISNSAKPFEICQQWTEYLYEEFFKQGDLEKEKGYTVSMFMDRNTTNIANSQIGFIDFILTPAFQHIFLLMPNIFMSTKALETNKQEWQKLIDHYAPKKDAKKIDVIQENLASLEQTNEMENDELQNAENQEDQ